ncbi:hypothetical protein ACJ73_08602 [Blastomyces percursus]|uniref:Grh/CP2 DB domain-containing protein n=1 Tax=Blastomyces percursus TaxID=1658174 RepID=A0A1J9QUU6_9EURO|nr:hypothetical protein ACJ73_08602 [Blastomyces percursus]
MSRIFLLMELNAKNHIDLLPHGISLSTPGDNQTNPGSRNFRFNVTLKAATAMAKYPDENPITYHNKGKTYTMSVLDTAPMASGALPLKYRTFIRVCLQGSKPASLWQLWKEGRGSNETHRSDEKLLAVEHMDPNQGGDGDIRPSQVQLETSNFDGFSVIWSPNPVTGNSFGDAITHQVFKSSYINCPGDLYSLGVLNGPNEQRLPLRDALADKFVFCQAAREGDAAHLVHELKLSSVSVRYRMRKGDEITGFEQVSKPYCLRDGAAKVYNESRGFLTVFYLLSILLMRLHQHSSDLLQNLILQHSSIDTFLKHYLDRNITADVLSIYRGLEPQKALMRLASSVSRSIDPQRPWKPTTAQSRRLRSEKQRARIKLKHDILKRYREEQPLIDIERQLTGKGVDGEVKGVLERSAYMTLEHLNLIDAILTLAPTSAEAELQRQITAIRAVTDYCSVERLRCSVRLGSKSGFTHRTDDYISCQHCQPTTSHRAAACLTAGVSHSIGTD